MKKCEKCKYHEARISGVFCSISGCRIRKFGSNDYDKIKCQKPKKGNEK